MIKHAVRLNSCTELAITKLDVLDGMPEVKVCVGYRIDGGRADVLPSGSEDAARCEPIYESFTGWSESTVGIRDRDALPRNAKIYLDRLQELCGTPIDMISTGPDRDETIVQRHPFK